MCCVYEMMYRAIIAWKNCKKADSITDRKSPGHQGPQVRQIEAKGKPSEKLDRIREAQKAPGRPEQIHSARERAAERAREAKWELRTRRP